MPKTKKSSNASRKEKLRAYRKLLKRHRKRCRRKERQRVTPSWERLCGPKALLSSLSTLHLYLSECTCIDDPRCDEEGNDLDYLSEADLERIAPLDDTPVNAREFVASVKVVLRELRDFFLPRLWTFQLSTARHPDGTVIGRDYLNELMPLSKFCELTEQPLEAGYYVKREQGTTFKGVLEESVSSLELEGFNEEDTQAYLRRMKWELTFAVGWLTGEVMGIKDFESYYEEHHAVRS